MNESRAKSTYAAEIAVGAPFLCEPSAELILPDYLPGAEKILLLSAVPAEESVTLTRGAFSYEGKITVTVLYAAEGGSVQVYTTVLPYGGRVEQPEIGGSEPYRFSPRVENAAGILQGRKKMKITMTLIADAAVYRGENAHPAFAASVRQAERESVVFLEGKKLPCAHLHLAEEREGSMNAPSELVLSEDEPAIGELLSAQGIIIPTSVTAGSTPTAEALLELRLVYAPAEGGVRLLRRRVPFSHRMQPIAAGEGSFPCDVRFDLRELRVEAKAGADGVKRAFTVRFDYGISMLLATPGEISPVLDCYTLLPDAVTVERRDERPILAVDGRVMGHFSADRTVPFAELGISPAPTELLGITLTPRFSGHYTVSPGGAPVLTGQAEWQAYFMTADGYAAGRGSIPLRYEGEEPLLYAGEGEREAGIRAVCDEIKATLTENGLRLQFETRLAGGLYLRRQPDGSYIREVALEPLADAPAPDPDDGQMWVYCYPEEGETLYDIGKRYRVSPRTLEKENPGERTAVYVGKKGSRE